MGKNTGRDSLGPCLGTSNGGTIFEAVASKVLRLKQLTIFASENVAPFSLFSLFLNIIRLCELLQKQCCAASCARVGPCHTAYTVASLWKLMMLV